MLPTKKTLMVTDDKDDNYTYEKFSGFWLKRFYFDDVNCHYEKLFMNWKLIITDGDHND